MILTASIALAYKCHEHQKRRFTGLPYITHLEEVANLVAQYSMDNKVIAAGMLHDLIEDTSATAQDIIGVLPAGGEFVANLVLEVTNDHPKEIDGVKLTRDQKFMHNYARLSKASPNAMLIKCCDIMSNCRDILDHDRVYGARYLAEKLAVISSFNTDESTAEAQALRKAKLDCEVLLSDRVEMLEEEHLVIFQEAVLRLRELGA